MHLYFFFFFFHLSKARTNARLTATQLTIENSTRLKSIRLTVRWLIHVYNLPIRNCIFVTYGFMDVIKRSHYDITFAVSWLENLGSFYIPCLHVY